MSSYFSKPRLVAWDDGVDYGDRHAVSQVTVYVPESSCRETGVLDERGFPIFASDRIRCGFLKHTS